MTTLLQTLTIAAAVAVGIASLLSMAVVLGDMHHNGELRNAMRRIKSGWWRPYRGKRRHRLRPVWWPGK